MTYGSRMSPASELLRSRAARIRRQSVSGVCDASGSSVSLASPAFACGTFVACPSAVASIPGPRHGTDQPIKADDGSSSVEKRRGKGPIASSVETCCKTLACRRGPAVRRTVQSVK
eukprot:s4314_g5.t1